MTLLFMKVGILYLHHSIQILKIFKCHKQGIREVSKEKVIAKIFEQIRYLSSYREQTKKLSQFLTRQL